MRKKKQQRHYVTYLTLSSDFFKYFLNEALGMKRSRSKVDVSLFIFISREMDEIFCSRKRSALRNVLSSIHVGPAGSEVVSFLDAVE